MSDIPDRPLRLAPELESSLRGIAERLRWTMERRGGFEAVSQATGLSADSLKRYASSDVEAARMRANKLLSVSVATHTSVDWILSGVGARDVTDTECVPIAHEKPSSDAYKFALAYADAVVAFLRTGEAQIIRRSPGRVRFRVVRASRSSDGEEIVSWVGRTWTSLSAHLSAIDVDLCSDESVERFRSGIVSQLVDCSAAQRVVTGCPGS